MGKKSKKKKQKRRSSRRKPQIIEETEPIRKRSPYTLPLIGLGFLALAAAGAGIYYSTRPSEEEVRVGSAESGKKERAVPKKRFCPELFDSEFGTITKQSAEKVDIIFIPQTHPLERQFEEAKGEDISTVPDITHLCRSLYDKHQVRSLMLEGALPIHAREYNKKRVPMITMGGFDMYPFLRKRAWTLYPAENPKNRFAQIYAQKKIKRIQADFKEEVRKELGKHIEKIYEKTREGYKLKSKRIVEPYNQRLNYRINELIEKYDRLIDRECEANKDQLMHLTIYAREDSVVSGCQKLIHSNNSPVIVVYGASHIVSLTNKFEEQDVSYCVLEPRSLPKDIYERQSDFESVKVMNHVCGKELVAKTKARFENGKAIVEFE